LPGALTTCFILTSGFIILKLQKKIKWTWGWVLCPIWFLIILNLGAGLHVISVNLLEPRGLPF
jgi:hypothetical protein